MTEQIVVKLNRKKFEPLLQDLIENDKFSSRTNTAIVAKLIYFVWVMHNEPCIYLDGKTRMQVLRDAIPDPKMLQMAQNEFARKFSEFIKTGNH